VDVRIGIQNSPRELSFETSQSAEEVERLVAAALSGQSPVLKLADDKGTMYVVPSSALAYVEIGSEESRRVGFVA
jgi:Protein of unknown function (DUF3107)